VARDGRRFCIRIQICVCHCADSTRRRAINHIVASITRRSVTRRLGRRRTRLLSRAAVDVQPATPTRRRRTGSGRRYITAKWRQADWNLIGSREEKETAAHTNSFPDPRHFYSVSRPTNLRHHLPTLRSIANRHLPLPSRICGT